MCCSQRLCCHCRHVKGDAFGNRTPSCEIWEKHHCVDSLLMTWTGDKLKEKRELFTSIVRESSSSVRLFGAFCCSCVDLLIPLGRKVIPFDRFSEIMEISVVLREWALQG